MNGAMDMDSSDMNKPMKPQRVSRQYNTLCICTCMVLHKALLLAQSYQRAGQYFTVQI